MNGQIYYLDRTHAGRVLADLLEEQELENPVLLAMPRGGLPVAREVAERLNIPMDVVVVRKIGAPFNPEYGIGALCEDFRPLFNAGQLLHFEDLQDEIKEIIEKEKIELQRRIEHYRGSRNLPDLKDKTVILVDDGLATGITAAAAGKYLKSKGAKKILLAVPVGPPRVSELLQENIDEIICPHRPVNLTAIGMWYKEFNQVSDEKVMAILRHYHPETNLGLSL